MAAELAGVVIGLSREDDEIILDETGDPNLLLASWRSGAPILVNDSIPAFMESFDLVQSMYPFYPPGSDLDIAERAENRNAAR